MYLRVTTYEFQQETQGDIAAWADTKTDVIRAIDGLVSVDAFTAGPGQGVIVAVYQDEDSFEAASTTITGVLGELGTFLTGPPITLAGTEFWSSRLGANA